MGHRARYNGTMSAEAAKALTLSPMPRVRATPTPSIPAMNSQSLTGLASSSKALPKGLWTATPLMKPWAG